MSKSNLTNMALKWKRLHKIITVKDKIYQETLLQILHAYTYNGHSLDGVGYPHRRWQDQTYR